MAARFSTRPSEIMGIEDSYTAYCFDEACAWILGQIESGEEPHYKREFKSFSELYRSLGV